MAEDAAEAVKWFRKAAEQGYAKAQYNLGISYYNGAGVTKDATESVKWFHKAAEQGEAQAQCNLGVSYATGEGVAKDDVEAFKWFSLACNQNLEFAKKPLAKVAGRMTKAQIAQAQRMARDFKPHTRHLNRVRPLRVDRLEPLSRARRVDLGLGGGAPNLEAKLP